MRRGAFATGAGAILSNGESVSSRARAFLLSGLISSALANPSGRSLDLSDNGFVGVGGWSRENPEYGILCYVDVLRDSIYNVSFDTADRPCYRKYSGFGQEADVQLVRYLASPRKGEEVVFLRHGAITGEGVVSSLGGGLSGGQSAAHCTVTSGKQADVVMSSSLYSAFNRDVNQASEDTALPAGIEQVVDAELQAKALNRAFVRDFHVTRMMAAPLETGTNMWLLTGRGTMTAKPPQQVVESPPGMWHLENGKPVMPRPVSVVVWDTLPCELTYVVNAIVLDRDGPVVDFVTATPDKSDSTTMKWLDYFDSYALRRDSAIFDNYGWGYDIYTDFTDWLDVDGDGINEVILKFNSYEGSGDILLKRGEDGWKEVVGYYFGV